MVALPEHFMAFTMISIVSWERRGTVEGEEEGKEQQYPEWVQSSREERSATKRKILKNNSAEV